MHTRLRFTGLAVAAITSTILLTNLSLAQPGPGSGGRGAGRGGPPNPSAIFDRMDKNDDGKLTKDEVPGPLWSRFSQADADNDDAVTQDELKAHMKKRAAEFKKNGGPPWAQAKRPGSATSEHKRGGPPWSRLGGGPARGAISDRFFKMLDKDGDGKISTDEARDKDRHKKADKDGDGNVTKDEFSAAAKSAFGSGRRFGAGSARGPQRPWGGMMRHRFAHRGHGPGSRSLHGRGPRFGHHSRGHHGFGHHGRGSHGDAKHHRGHHSARKHGHRHHGDAKHHRGHRGGSKHGRGHRGGGTHRVKSE